MRKRTRRVVTKLKPKPETFESMGLVPIETVVGGRGIKKNPNEAYIKIYEQVGANQRVVYQAHLHVYLHALGDDLPTNRCNIFIGNGDKKMVGLELVEDGIRKLSTPSKHSKTSPLYRTTFKSDALQDPFFQQTKLTRYYSVEDMGNYRYLLRFLRESE